MKVFFLSLGCDKNLCDSEHMLYDLFQAGYEFTDDEAEADIIIVNTCSFIGDAKQESIDEILRLAEYKESGQLKALIACGCLSERYQEEILKELPELDGVFGTGSWDKAVCVVEEALKGKKTEVFYDPTRDPKPNGRILTTAGGYAFLKIAEGCDKNCTYCIIPKNRGHYRSFPMEELVEEARTLTEKGVTELILVAQETTVYGKDLYGKKSLPELLKKLSKIEDLKWIRLMYCYPEEIDEELLYAMKELPKVVRYLDLPVQSASDRILKRMNRRTNSRELLNKIALIRKILPGTALRTTLISGFPGETEEDAEETLKFVKKAKFERLGVFTYSPEEDTPAALFEDQVEENVKEERRDRLMAAQQRIAFKQAESMVGKTLPCIVEGMLTEDSGIETDGQTVYAGRTYMDAPEVDGMIFILSDNDLLSGAVINVNILSSEGYDLIGEQVYESAE